ncbi:alpha/beta fold hydrolase [Rhizobium puerariae]|uniref:Alpha/beta fold hydrolase n=1 Tax=Rhizobium puerariae TaxID=1585791 RepID=A0ABV6AEF7_9HYPH
MAGFDHTLVAPPEVGDLVCPRRISAGGTAYHEVGEGEALLLIHGVGMRLEAWAPQIAELAKTHRVIAVDMPGHGESAGLPVGSTIVDFVAWLGGFLDDMQLARVNIAGHSMGAMISGGAVATFPERIARIAYLNGVHRRDPDAKAAVLARAASIAATGVDKEGPLLRWFGSDPQSDRARQLTRRWLEQVNPEGYAVAYSAFAAGDDVFYNCWAKVVCPAMFLTGDGDPNSTPEMAETMAAQARNGWARIIVGHRHMVNLTAPGIVNDMMREWLATEERPK